MGYSIVCALCSILRRREHKHGRHTAIADTIIERSADYVLVCKSDQGRALIPRSIYKAAPQRSGSASHQTEDYAFFFGRPDVRFAVSEEISAGTWAMARLTL
jgi:hypothetical protein